MPMIEEFTKKDKSAIVFSGDLSVAQAAELQQQLLKTATTVSRVHVKVAEVENMDLSFLQLLLSWAQNTKQSGKKLTFDFQLDEEFTRIFEESGFRAAFGEL
jgi:anti-anti-sigma factor